jgi:hypothetical protein
MAIEEVKRPAAFVLVSISKRNSQRLAGLGVHPESAQLPVRLKLFNEYRGDVHETPFFRQILSV